MITKIGKKLSFEWNNETSHTRIAVYQLKHASLYLNVYKKNKWKAILSIAQQLHRYVTDIT